MKITIEISAGVEDLLLEADTRNAIAAALRVAAMRGDMSPGIYGTLAVEISEALRVAEVKSKTEGGPTKETT